MVRALYPGSFDPVTRGHTDLVDRALRMFDSVTVAVAENLSKRSLFNLEERCGLLRTVLPDDARVEVATFDGLVVDYCKRHGIQAILRGVRTVSDFEYEYQMALTNRHLAPGVETVFVMPSAEYSFLSSSLMKEVVKGGGDASRFLHPDVEQKMRERLLDR